MKKHVTFGIAMASVTAIAGTALPPAASASVAQADAGKAQNPALDLSTPEAAKAFFERIGIAPERIERFAAGLGLDANGYYAVVAEAFNAKKTNRQPEPIEVSADGKVKYSNTASKSLNFTRTQTRSQTGKKVSGRCVFDPLAMDSRLGDNLLSEVVEFDPANCTRTVFDGAYDPATVQNSTASAQAPQFLNCNSLTNPPTTYSPAAWVDGEWRRYYKQSFVDPVCITITSSTLNVRWKNTVNSGTDVTILTGTAGDRFYYTDLGENWPNSQKQVWLVPASNESTTGPTERTAFLGHIRTETDFPEHLALAAAATGAAGLITALIACQFDLSDTTFASDQTLKVRRNQGWWASGSGSVWGGCSSLVHERVWHGGGTFAR